MEETKKVIDITEGIEEAKPFWKQTWFFWSVVLIGLCVIALVWAY